MDNKDKIKTFEEFVEAWWGVNFHAFFVDNPHIKEEDRENQWPGSQRKYPFYQQFRERNPELEQDIRKRLSHSMYVDRIKQEDSCRLVEKEMYQAYVFMRKAGASDEVLFR